jgi:predicted HicB family RNase H-like nuclease
MKTKHFNFAVPESMHKRVRIAAAKEGVPMGEWIKSVIAEALRGKR